jgi:hypothetical protein
MSAHTPGPWTKSEGSSVAALNFRGDPGRTRKIADVYAGGGTLAERHANAHLVAAAPELLEALRTMLAYATTADSQAVAKAKAAIAKAEGKP